MTVMMRDLPAINVKRKVPEKPRREGKMRLHQGQ